MIEFGPQVKPISFCIADYAVTKAQSAIMDKGTKNMY
jgi:hypothetical protein